MAQETGIFSVRRPRETLGGINYNGTSIPMPSSAMKRSNSMSNPQAQLAFSASGHSRSTSGPRMSLAPPGRPNTQLFQRSSSGTNLADMGYASAHRTSTANMMGSASRKSIAPGGIASTPAPLDQSQRRSSIFHSRGSSSIGGGNGGIKQSFFATAPPPAGIPADPRRLKDASVRQQMASELLEYLTRGNFEMDMKHNLSNKSMTSPTQKDFNCMFQWLYHRIDPNYRFLKSIDAEVPPLLKQMRYPFEKSIMKSQIAAVGGNNWSTFLGLLHWMMQLAKMMDEYSAGTYDEACEQMNVDVMSDRITFDFLSDAYSTWLSFEDDTEADSAIKQHIATMAEKFDRANSKYADDLEALEAENKGLQDRIDSLGKSQPILSQLTSAIETLGIDLQKFEAYNARLADKEKKYAERIDILEDLVKKTEAELEEAEQERQSLQEKLDSQGITIQDIDRTVNERERLEKAVESTATRLEESKRKAAEKENEASQKLDELERTVEKYNTLGYKIGIIPSTARNAKGVDFELVLTLSDSNPSSNQFSTSISSHLPTPTPEPQSAADRLLADTGTGYAPHQIVKLDLRGGIKNALLTMRKEISERRNVAMERDMNNHEMLDKVREAIDEKQAEVEALEHRTRAAEEEFEKTREITTAQKMNSDAQIERMEKELSKMRAGLTESVQIMEQREMNTNIEYEQLTLRAAALREELHTEVERMLNDVIKFKVHIQKSLEDYEVFVADEVEKETKPDGADADQE